MSQSSLSLEQHLGLLRIIESQNQRINDLTVSLSALVSAIWDDRSAVGDRYYRYLDVQKVENEIVPLSAAE